jgi:hypothetical protein
MISIKIPVYNPDLIDLSFAMIPKKKREFGACDMEI